MVTVYDVFEVVYKNRRSLKPIEVVKRLNKSEREYNNIHRLLTELEKNQLLNKTKFGFQAKRTAKTELLFNLIYFCLSNGINYNLLLNLRLARFINRVLSKKEFSPKDVKINPRTFAKYIQILNKCGLLLVISKKPLRVKMFYNSLVNNLLIYFGLKHFLKEKEGVDYLKEIKEELTLFKKRLKKNEAGYRQIVDGFEISFVHHSLALEGNPITLPDTIKILKDKIIPQNLSSEAVDEVKNYQTAVFQMLKDSQEKKPLTIQTILDYHRLAMQHRPEIAGQIRKVRVYIKGNPYFKVAEVSDIKPKLNQLLDGYHKFIRQKNPLKEVINFTAFFHNELQYIHPFVDGNSRIARLITFYLLRSQGIPIFDIPFGLLDKYLKYTKGSREREDKKLFENLQEIILFNLKKINGRLSS